MFSMNVIIGSLGRDPEIRTMQTGGKVANLSVATSERWKDKNSGEWKEKTEWHRVVIFGPSAEYAEKALRKGSLCLVVGTVKTRKWQDQSGNDKYTTETVVSGFEHKIKALSKHDQGEGESSSGSEGSSGDDWGEDNNLDDEIPF